MIKEKKFVSKNKTFYNSLELIKITETYIKIK